MDTTLTNNTRTGRGADSGQPRPRLSIYIERHAAALISSLGVLWRTPIATLATILALGVTLVFPSLLGVAMINAVSLAALWNEGGQVTVYVRTEAGPGEIDRLTALLRQQPGVRTVSHITPEAGLVEFREAAG
jgi:cell division transport system permease protein